MDTTVIVYNDYTLAARRNTFSARVMVSVPNMMGSGPTDLRGAIDRLNVPAMGAPVTPSGAAPPPSALKRLASMVPTGRLKSLLK